MQYLLSGKLTEGSVSVTEITNPFSETNPTAKLYSGLNVYGGGLKVETEIGVVDGPTEITLTSPATKTGVFPLEFSETEVGRWHERNCALIDAYQTVNDIGKMVKFVFRTEKEIGRGNYGGAQTLKSAPTYRYRAYPIQYGPNPKLLMNMGLNEQCDVAISVPSRYFSLSSWNWTDIDPIRTTVIIDDEVFTIKDRARTSQFADWFLYYTFGLARKP